MVIERPRETPLPVFRRDLCTGSGRCAEVCPEQALEMVNGRPRLRPGVVCTYCGECERACPSGAISLSYEIVLGPIGRDED